MSIYFLKGLSEIRADAGSAEGQRSKGHLVYHCFLNGKGIIGGWSSYVPVRIFKKRLRELVWIEETEAVLIGRRVAQAKLSDTVSGTYRYNTVKE